MAQPLNDPIPLGLSRYRLSNTVVARNSQRQANAHDRSPFSFLEESIRGPFSSAQPWDLVGSPCICLLHDGTRTEYFLRLWRGKLTKGFIRGGLGQPYCHHLLR